MTMVTRSVFDRVDPGGAGPSDGPGIDDEVDDFDAPEPVRGWRSLSLGGAAYLALSIAVWWNVWSTHPTSTTTCGCGDTSLFTWFLAWPAHAIAHGLNPFYSTQLFHPTGVNLLSNTAESGLGILLAPVTWAFGPIATLNVALTLSPALSAFTMYVLLRRWVSWAPAAFAGGLLYGFSPFVLISLTDAHLMIGMAAVPPLVVLCLDEMLARQEWRWWVTGLTIAGLAFVEFFLGTELLVMTAIVAAIAIVMVVAGAAALRRDALRARAPYALRAGGVAAVSSVALLAWPAWFALAGPAHLSGRIWGSELLSYGGTSFRQFVSPMAPLAKVTELTHQFGGYQGPTLSDQYFGFGVLAVVVVGLLAWDRNLRMWLLAYMGAVCAFLSVGLSFGGWTPWRLFIHLPLMDNIIPSRFILFTYLCVSAMLAVVIDTVRTLAMRRAPHGVSRSIIGWVTGLVVAAIALVPIFSYFAGGLPLKAVPVTLPEWFSTVAPELPPNQVLVVFPFSFRQGNMTWQAVNGMNYSLVGGGGPDSLLSRTGKERPGYTVLAKVSFGGQTQSLESGEVTAVRSALAGWGATKIVLPDPKYLPTYDRTSAVRSVVVLMTAATGQIPEYRAKAWVWSGIGRATPPATPTTSQLNACAAGSGNGTVASIEASARCILAPPTTP